MNSKFQETLKQIEFRTVHCDQVVTYGYNELFADRRVIVFSLTNTRTICSGRQVVDFGKHYAKFQEIGIDTVYAVDSTDWLVAPWMSKRSKHIIGLPDKDMSFVKSLAEHYNYQKQTFDLARYWQYIVIINKGEPEKIWHNPFNENAPLAILKDPSYRYRKLSAETVYKYLVDNK